MQDCLAHKKLHIVSDFLVAADFRGNYGYGLYRLEQYLNEIRHGIVKADGDPRVMRETEVVAHVNGNRALGVIVGNFCMDLAVKKALETGVGLVVAKQSAHFGMASWYVLRAMNSGCIGLALSNLEPSLLAPGTCSPRLGANRMAFGAKGLTKDFVFDMATSVKDLSAVEMGNLKQENIPPNWAADDEGKSTRKPLNAKGLFPAGGHKGYCLSALIELLCGVLSGANNSTNIPNTRRAAANKSGPNLGQLYIAIDPTFFVPDFKERLDDFHSLIDDGSSEDSPVLQSGVLERQHMLYFRDLRALPYPNALIAMHRNSVNELRGDIVCRLLGLLMGNICEKFIIEMRNLISLTFQMNLEQQ